MGDSPVRKELKLCPHGQIAHATCLRPGQLRRLLAVSSANPCPQGSLIDLRGNRTHAAIGEGGKELTRHPTAERRRGFICSIGRIRNIRTDRYRAFSSFSPTLPLVGHGGDVFRFRPRNRPLCFDHHQRSRCAVWNPANCYSLFALEHRPRTGEHEVTGVRGIGIVEWRAKNIRHQRQYFFVRFAIPRFIETVLIVKMDAFQEWQ
jgi:hypothetical protein